MSTAIACARDRRRPPLSAPNLRGALRGWGQPLQIELIRKKIVNFEVAESDKVTVKVAGTIHPFTPQQVMTKPEGQRIWKWWRLYAGAEVTMEPDDIAIIRGVRYRVKEKWDFSSYGFFQYDLIEDYQRGSGL